MKGTDVRRAVAEDRHGNVIATLHLGGIGGPGRDRDAGPDDRERRQQSQRTRVQVHRAAESTHASDGPAGDLSKDLTRRHAEGERMTMAAVGAAHLVGRAQRSGEPDGDRFLALAGVRRTVDQPFAEQLLGALLEAPDLEHPLPAGDTR